uniref:Uncharacterized protein n=1 Tax=Fusarium oxysporum (strain Fo5176) TaxID=660025 RepID=A0A0D2XHC9_FUSOF
MSSLMLNAPILYFELVVEFIVLLGLILSFSQGSVPNPLLLPFSLLGHFFDLGIPAIRVFSISRRGYGTELFIELLSKNKCVVYEKFLVYARMPVTLSSDKLLL